MPAFAGRFEREARLLARLSHPNIVSVYDYGQAGEFFYLLMEYVDGVNLRQAMRAGRFDPRQALAIVPRICDALQYAHDEGVLHRDIKPENILLDAKGRVKLVDFGIAKLAAEAEILSSTRNESGPAYTQAGALLGTPSYMAPEQRDHPSDVDHRADIYSLGVVFYELLTGELPTGSIPRPSEKSAADPRVDAIVQQALEKERERRQGSAGEVRTQVETIAGGPTPPAPVKLLRGGQEQTSSRFSRLAIVGACWSPFFFMAFVGMFTVHLAIHTTQGEPLPYQGPNLIQQFFIGILILLGALAPFGTTICGWIAITQIRRSSGRLYGLGLAVFDGLLFPLLALDGLITWAWWQLIEVAFPEFVNGSLVSLKSGGEISLHSVALILTLLTCVVADILISWFVWRKVRGSALGVSIPFSPNEPARGIGQATSSSRLALFGVLFALMSIGCEIVALFHGLSGGPAALLILASGLTTIVFGLLAARARLGKLALLLLALQIITLPVVWTALLSPTSSLSASAMVHELVFEVDARTVDELVPVPSRDRVELSGAQHLSTPPNAASQVALVNHETISSLLHAMSPMPGMLNDAKRQIRMWPMQSDGWSSSRASATFNGNASGGGFLGVQRAASEGGALRFRVDESIFYGYNVPVHLYAQIFYEGSAPPSGFARIFLIPFTHTDGKSRYLIVAFQLDDGIVSEMPVPVVTLSIPATQP